MKQYFLATVLAFGVILSGNLIQAYADEAPSRYFSVNHAMFKLEEPELDTLNLPRFYENPARFEETMPQSGSRFQQPIERVTPRIIDDLQHNIS